MSKTVSSNLVSNTIASKEFTIKRTFCWELERRYTTNLARYVASFVFVLNFFNNLVPHLETNKQTNKQENKQTQTINMTLNLM